MGNNYSYNPSTKTINADPNFKPVVQTTAGPQPTLWRPTVQTTFAVDPSSIF
jgi:hypothetical protein